MITALLFLCLISATALAKESGGRVVGGSDTDIVYHNYQLSLRVYGSHICGASLISTTRGVTVAHCGGNPVSTYSICASSTERACYGDTRTLSDFVAHANYSETSEDWGNDIAVIKWTTALVTSSHVGIITMADENSGNFAGQTCTITGWGRTCGTCSPLPDTLQEGEMTVMTNAACESVWGSSYISEGHVCLTSSSVSACMGDSGGPLVCGNTLVGASSWVHYNCNPSYPSVYTRISYFYTWINNNL